MPEDRKSSRESSREKIEGLPKKEEKKISFQKNFLLMDDDDLKKEGIIGCRLKLAEMLKSKVYDVLMIILIVFYTLLIFLYFTFQDSFFNTTYNQNAFYIIELSILGVFVVEIFLHLLVYHLIYFRDYWNIFDLVIIILSYIFVFLDMFVDNNELQGFLKIRGIFRLLRVFLLIRKLSHLKLRRDMSKRRMILKSGYDLRSPLERVLEILNNFRD
jgi:hypothetical protein